jgi:hypothetical protein
MQNVVCCNHARMRSNAGKSTQYLNACVCGRIESMAGRMSGDSGMREVNEL